MVERDALQAAEDGPFAFLSRRRLLKWGLLGGSIALMGGGGQLSLRGCAPKIKGLKSLSAQEFRTLTALAETHIPRGGGFSEGAADFDLARQFDIFLSQEPVENRTQLKMALLLLEFGPVLFARRLTTFSHLSQAERLAHWESWISSPRLLQRQVSVAFRKFFSLVFYDQPRVWRHIGYPGPAFGGGKP